MNRSVVHGVGLALALAAPARALAFVPDPTQSTLPPCVVLCPAGDLSLRYVIRDVAHNPIPGCRVKLDFSSCPVFTHCPTNASDRYTIDEGSRTVMGVTDGSGELVLPIRMGGTCDRVMTYANSGTGDVLMAQKVLASPDQDADLLVNGVDLTIAMAKIGSADLTADFDCDRSVTDADMDFLRAHLDHLCPLPTPVRRGSWGTLKIRYR